MNDLIMTEDKVFSTGVEEPSLIYSFEYLRTFLAPPLE